MTDILADHFESIADLTDDSDWRDVRRRARRGGGRSIRSLLAAAVVGAAVAAAPALAFSPSVQRFVGLKKPAPPASTSWTRPRLVAKLTGLYFHKLSRFDLPLVTVSFTIGEAGKPAGTGITFGSYFQVHLESRTGASSGPWLVRAYGAHGHYRATLPVPPGGIAGILINGFINVPKGPSVANGTFFGIKLIIPVVQQH